jgi:hypothetical protein
MNGPNENEPALAGMILDLLPNLEHLSLGIEVCP